MTNYDPNICEILKEYILSGNFKKAKEISKSLEADELENCLVEIGCDTCNIIPVVLVKK